MLVIKSNEKLTNSSVKEIINIVGSYKIYPEHFIYKETSKIIRTLCKQFKRIKRKKCSPNCFSSLSIFYFKTRWDLNAKCTATLEERFLSN